MVNMDEVLFPEVGYLLPRNVFTTISVLECGGEIFAIEIQEIELEFVPVLDQVIFLREME